MTDPRRNSKGDGGGAPWRTARLLVVALAVGSLPPLAMAALVAASGISAVTALLLPVAFAALLPALLLPAAGLVAAARGRTPSLAASLAAGLAAWPRATASLVLASPHLWAVMLATALALHLAEAALRPGWLLAGLGAGLAVLIDHWPAALVAVLEPRAPLAARTRALERSLPRRWPVLGAALVPVAAALALGAWLGVAALPLAALALLPALAGLGVWHAGRYAAAVPEAPRAAPRPPTRRPAAAPPPPDAAERPLVAGAAPEAASPPERVMAPEAPERVMPPEAPERAMAPEAPETVMARLLDAAFARLGWEMLVCHAALHPPAPDNPGGLGLALTVFAVQRDPAGQLCRIRAAGPDWDAVRYDLAAAITALAERMAAAGRPWHSCQMTVSPEGRFALRLDHDGAAPALGHPWLARFDALPERAREWV